MSIIKSILLKNGHLNACLKCCSQQTVKQLYRKMCALNGGNDNAVMIYDTFSKTKREMKLNNETVSGNEWRYALMYCCGPTVYDDCHLGHAINYMRCDLIKRVLHHYFNVYVIIAMGVTDIDDKIITKAKQTNSDYRSVSNTYYSSFLEDMQSLNIMGADFYLRVTDHINEIVAYIQHIHRKGFAYVSQTGDVNFDAHSFAQSFDISFERFPNDASLITEKSIGKKSPKDFTLWKASKPGEPFWSYTTPDGLSIAGRPGWHIECSAMSTAVLGDNIDLHFGGKDLIFPHHHCESLCCFAYQQIINKSENSNSIYDWCKFWLHSGQLIFKSEKMSKSLGNVVRIKQFLSENSPNLLRLLCIRNYYRSDIDFDDDFLKNIKILDKKLLDFHEGIRRKIEEVSAQNFLDITSDDNNNDCNYFSSLIKTTEMEILKGIADDIDLNRGLEAILLLIKEYNSRDNFALIDLVKIKKLVDKWLSTVGLVYNQYDNYVSNRTLKENVMLDMLVKLRSNVREISLKSIKLTNNENNLNELRKNSEYLLSLCDELRKDLDTYGIKIKDLQIVPKNK